MFFSRAEIIQLHTIKINTENLFKITQSTDMLSLNNLARFFFSSPALRDLPCSQLKMMQDWVNTTEWGLKSYIEKERVLDFEQEEIQVHARDRDKKIVY